MQRTGFPKILENVQIGNLIDDSIFPPVKPGRMYAIAFDLDIELLKATYGDPYNNAYAEIKKFLVGRGFDWQQGSVYFGDQEKINAVTCVVAVNELSKTLPWFAASVRDIRMLRIEEYNDLRPALELGA